MTDTRVAPKLDKRRKKYRSDGTPLWSKPLIDGPGVWVSCVKGKEKQTVGELYDLFDSLASDLWPDGSKSREEEDTHSDSANEIESQISKEVFSIKRPKTERRFVNCLTHTPCVVFIACKPPVDPVKLVEAHIRNVKNTGVTRTRYSHRFVPVSGTCTTNIPEIQGLFRTVFSSFSSQKPESTFTYKVELRIRNHTTLSRPSIIQNIADCVPACHKVDLTNPQIFILVEVFKSVCGIAITEHYYDLAKFNVMEIANSTNEKLVS